MDAAGPGCHGILVTEAVRIIMATPAGEPAQCDLAETAGGAAVRFSYSSVPLGLMASKTSL